MADIDTLPQRGVPALALVDSTGIASNGSQTVAQLTARGVRSVCAVDATGVSVGGASVAQLASAGIRAFCPVDETGVAQDSTTALALRQRGIRPMVLLNNTGIALTGSATMLTLRQRGLDYFCPVDESGNATTMGAVILISNTTVSDNITIGTTVGVLSVVSGTGTYTFTLTNSAGGKFTTAGTNGVNLNTAATLTAGSYSIIVSATNGVTPISRTIVITVTPFVALITLNAQTGAFTMTGEDMTPTTGFSLSCGVGAFTETHIAATLTYSGAVVFSITPQTAPAPVLTAGATHNFGSCTIGTGSSSRYLAICTMQRASVNTQLVSSISISGYAGTYTKVTGIINATATGSEIWVTNSAVTAGPTATVSIVYAGSNDRSAIQIYSIVAPGTVVPSGSAIGTSTANAPTASITSPSGGCAIGCSYATTGGPGTPTATPAGFNNLDINSNIAGAHEAWAMHANAGFGTGSAQTLTMTLTSATNNSASFAAWGP